MLSIHVLKSTSAASKYYTAIFDYYGKEGQGLWDGKLKEYLSLREEVDHADFSFLLKGELNGKNLNTGITDKHRPGFDLTFSAPKSVSILACLDICPELKSYHDQAVNHALKEIEKEFAEVRCKSKGKITYHKTENLLFAKFREYTSRSLDPQLHTHVVTMNLSKFQDKILSLASDMQRRNGVIENIQDNLKYCGMLYRAHLAKSLKDAGFTLKAQDNGLFEIARMPDGMLAHFSKRRADIKEFMEENNISGAKAAAFATLATRTSKIAANFQDLKAQWKLEAQEFNLNPHDLTKQSFFADILGGNAKLTTLKPIFEALAGSKIAFSERDIIAQTLKHELLSNNPLALDEIKALISAHTKNQDLHYSPKYSLYTTQKLLEAEVSAICLALRQQNTCVKIGSLQKSQHYIKAAAFIFTKSQTKALQTILESKDRFLAIQGYAGTAKTTMLKVASSIAHDLGLKVKGVTAASSAANTLNEKANIEAFVLPVVIQELQKAKTNSLQKHIYILDEASTLNVTSTLELMQEIKRTGSRLIMVGDKAQLPSVNNDKIFALLQDFGINTAVMDEILRQKTANLKNAVHAVISNKISKALDNINLVEAKSYQERINKIADIYAAKTPGERADTLVFAPTNKARHNINQAIREKLLEAKALDNTKNLTLNTLSSKPLNKVEHQYAQSYQKDEVIKLNQQVTDATAGYYKVLDVESKHTKHQYISITNERGQKFNIGLKYLTQERSIERYDAKSQEFYKNELIIFTRNFLKDNIRNSETATIIDLTSDKVVFKSSKQETFELPKTHPALKHMDYGYAITDYKSQGKDSTHAIGLMDSKNKFATTKNHLYVQISRAVTSMTLVTDDKERLISAIKGNDNLPKSALDISGLTPNLNMQLNLAIHKESEIKNPEIEQKTLELGEK